MRSKLQRWDDNLFKEFKPETPHAEYSPSKFHRMVNCPWSERYEPDKGTQPTESKEITLGILAHKLAAYKLRYKYTKNDIELISRHLISDITQEDFNLMDKLTDEYVEYIAGKIGDYSIVRVEEPLDMSSWIEDTFGTCDCLIFNPNELTIIDFKYGLKEIDAIGNEQLIAYAVGAMCAIDWRARPEKINLVIYQPRTNGNTIKWHKISYEKLLDEAKRIKEGLAKIKTATLADRNAGDFCEYCYNKVCPLKIKRIQDILSIDFKSEFISDEEIIMLQAVKREVNRLLKQFDDGVDELYEDGKILKNYKLMYSPGRKEWTDTEAVKQILEENSIDALITPSPAQLLKMLTAEQVDELQLQKYINQTKKKKGYAPA